LTGRRLHEPTCRRRRLGVRARRIALITHIAAAGAWLGVDVAMAVLIVTAMTSSDRGTLAFTLQALELVTVWPLLSCGLVCLLSGVVLGLGGRWECCATGGSRPSSPSASSS
jgi:hypothetical protein